LVEQDSNGKQSIVSFSPNKHRGEAGKQSIVSFNPNQQEQNESDQMQAEKSQPGAEQ
jgi:hypothetical protein